MSTPRRFVTVSLHGGRPAALSAAAGFIAGMSAHGITCLLDPEHLRALGTVGDTAELTSETGQRSELAVVFGGDGSLLRAAEWALPLDIPVLGVNLGHVGFLAELDEGEVREAVRQIHERDYEVEHRMTVDVRVVDADGRVRHGWAINEASIEKDPAARMVELAIGVDGRGLESFGCDGVVLATPTGSTAYAFSAGGPVVWPDVEALLLVPLNAHALFARPLVVGPSSVLEVELLQRNRGGAMVWCDGRRTIHLAPGARVEVRRGAQTVALARLRPGPFTARLVRKFALPVTGWRGEDGA